MNNKSKPHWQIKTVPITTPDDDELSHDSIAELLDEKISYLFNEDNVPSCICLNGEYGSGKSTIINLLFEKWKSATNKKVVHFNIWRHKEENTYYALFRNIFYALKNKGKKDFRQNNFLESITESDEILELDAQFSELVYASFSRKKTDQAELTKGLAEFVKELPNYTKMLTWGLIKTVFWGSLIIGVFAGIIDFAIDQIPKESILFSLKVFLISITSSSIISILSKNIFKNLPTLFKFHVQPAEQSISLPAITNTEQLQCVFRNILNKHSNNHGSEKLLIVIEDVDRKHNDEIIDTLNELRTFIDLGKAIFIIPCDLRNIERAFYDSAIDKSSDIDEQYIRWKSKDFCSKIFSHTISLPPQGQQDLRQFLVNKINSECPNNPLKLLLNGGDNFEQLIDVLLVNSIKTPREAINIYNRFTLQIEHALKLEEKSSRLKKGTISKNILPYARVYMLSTYYGLEKHLLKYPELPNWIIDYFRNREEHYDQMQKKENNFVIELGDTIPNYVHKYFINLIKTGVISLEVEEFISRTEVYGSPLIKPFIYLDEISYSGLLGSTIYGNVVNSLKSRNIKAVIRLLEEDKEAISIVISKILANVSYSSDFQSYVPSLIDIIQFIDPDRRKAIADFTLEHFDRVGNNILYAFPTENIQTIFSLGSRTQSEKAKKTYFSVLNKERTSVTDYCSEEKVFQIILMLINAINQDNSYVNIETKELVKDISSVPVEEAKEFEQIEQLLDVINELEESTIIVLFAPEILIRFTTDLDTFCNESADINGIKESINKLFSIFITVDKAKTLEAINSISISNNEHLIHWFIQLVGEYEEYFKEKNELIKVHNNIKINVIDNYLTEDNFTKNTDLINKTIELFAKLDGYAFRKFDSKNTDSFHALVISFKELITSDISSDFLEFIYCIIDRHENIAKYSFTNTLMDSIIELIKTKLVNYSTKSNEFALCKVTATFLTRSNRLSTIKEDKWNNIRDVVFPQLQQHISQNNANTDLSESLFKFVQTLNYDPKFGDILVKWIVHRNIQLANNSAFANYRDYLNVLNLVIERLPDEYLTHIITLCNSLITTNPGNEKHTIDAWKWVDKISKVNHSIPTLKNTLVPWVISNYKNKDSYFTGNLTKYIIRFVNRFSPLNGEADQNIFNELLLWAMEEEPEVIQFLDLNLEYFDINQKLKIINYIDDIDKWEAVLPSLIRNPSSTNVFLKHLIIEEKNSELISKIYSETKDIINWSDISLKSVKEIFDKIDFVGGEFINSLDNRIIVQFNISNLKDEFDVYLFELLKDNIYRKFLALELIDKFGLSILPKSNLAYAIKNDFIDTCDINNEIEDLIKVRKWIKKHELTKSTGIISKFKEIKKLSEGNFARKLDSIIKYG